MGRFLTPDLPPAGEFWVRKLYIPADPNFGALVSGALLDLCYPSSYEQFGDATPDEVAEIMSTMYDRYVTNDQEPPFWEDDTDVDQEAPVDQPWYDNLADWVIEGFLAISGFPTAAIVYSTSVPKIRVALRAGNFGALFKVLLNNVEMYTGDSYAPIEQLIGQTFDLQAFATANSLGAPPWTLRIEHNGSGPSIPEGSTATLSVVRKRLTDEMPIQFRQDDPCLLEYSEDGGGSWTTAADLSLCVPNDLPVGAILPYAVSTAPTGWLNCDGASVSRATYADLFAAIGTTFGSVDGSHFTLPDMRGRAPIGQGQGAGLTNRALAATTGEETHTLSSGELPSHGHLTWAYDGYAEVQNQASSGTLGLRGGGSFSGQPTGLTGSGSAHNTMQPSVVLNFIIKY